MSQCNELPPKYKTWLDNAFDEMRQLLSTGCALKIVTLHLNDYFAWLKAEDACDSTSARKSYLKALAEPGSNLSGISDAHRCSLARVSSLALMRQLQSERRPMGRHLFGSDIWGERQAEPPIRLRTQWMRVSNSWHLDEHGTQECAKNSESRSLALPVGKRREAGCRSSQSSRMRPIPRRLCASTRWTSLSPGGDRGRKACSGGCRTGKHAGPNACRLPYRNPRRRWPRFVPRLVDIRIAVGGAGRRRPTRPERRAAPITTSEAFTARLLLSGAARTVTNARASRRSGRPSK
jgi:hypothetical protein